MSQDITPVNVTGHPTPRRHEVTTYRSMSFQPGSAKFTQILTANTGIFALNYIQLLYNVKSPIFRPEKKQSSKYVTRSIKSTLTYKGYLLIITFFYSL